MLVFKMLMPLILYDLEVHRHLELPLYSKSVSGGSLNFPANKIAFNSLSRTKNKNGLLMLISLGTSRAALKPTSSIEDAAAPTVPSLVTSIVALCLIWLTLRGLYEKWQNISWKHRSNLYHEYLDFKMSIIYNLFRYIGI